MSTDLAPDLGLSLGAIAKLCREFGVRTLEAFRSQVDDGDSPTANWSFSVVFDPDDKRRIAPRWVGLEDGLERIFGRPVDLIGPAALENPYLRREVARTGHRVFPPS